MILRPYQVDVIARTRDQFRTGIRSVVVVCPTGSGKTALSANMLHTAASKNMAAWFIVHRRELIRQTINAFNAAGIHKFGVVASGFMEAKGHPLQICSIQTMIHRHNRFRKPTLIAWDECHHNSAGTYTKIYDAYKTAFHIGLTATPQRLDGRGLSTYFKSMVNGPSVAWLIENGYLCPYKLYAPAGISVDGVHTLMGDYKKAELAKAADRPSITGDAIKHYQRFAPDRRAVVFCVGVEHSKHVVEQFNKVGIPAAHVDGDTPTEVRDGTIEQFKAGRIKILSNVELFGEGFDLPALEAVILLRPTQSLGLYLQQVGRVLRPSPGKDHAIILDHAGNCERHGLPDQERIWSLDGRDKTSAGSSGGTVKICPRCFAAVVAGSTECKYCQFEFGRESRPVETKDGELVEVDQKEVRRLQLKAQGKCGTVQELIAEGKRRGFKHPERWAHHVMQARQVKKLEGVGR